jgi:hypothetical protein
MKILKYQELISAIRNSEGDELRTAYNVAAVLTNKDAEYYRQMSWIDFIAINKTLSIPEIGDINGKPAKQFTIEDETFFVDQLPTEWNGETFISMSTLTKENDAIVNNLHQILATCCYKVKGEDIPLAEFERRAILFQENLEVEVGYPIGFFFALLLVGLQQVIHHSSKGIKVNKRKLKKLLKALNQTG